MGKQETAPSDKIALQTQLDKKIAALNKLKGELKLEASLEKVRLAALNMRKSDELITVCKAMYEQLKELGFSNMRNAQIATKNDSRQSYIVCEYSDHTVVVKQEAPYNSSPIVKVLHAEMEKSADAFYQKQFSGKEFEEWRTWRTNIGTPADSRIEQAQSMCFYLYSFGTGYMGISTFNPVSNSQLKILKRFKNVFELSYRRCLDIENAEAQAKEARIQLALERVRARTMAMQKSEELSDAVYILFQQFKELGENPDQATIGIINEQEWVIEYWVTMYGSQMNRVFKFSIDEPNVTHRIYDAWKKQEKSLVIDLHGQELYDFSNYRASKGGAAFNPDEQQRIINVAFFSKGLINVQSHESRSAESIHLLERFATVFEQTYTRFLDLQKAEAQARESQIEAALEKVRSRSLAMNKSDELKAVVWTVMEKMKELNIDMNGGVSLATYIPGTNDLLHWYANPSHAAAPLTMRLPYFSHLIFDDFISARNNNQELMSKVYAFEEKNAYFNYAFEHSEFKNAPDELKQWILEQPYFGYSVAIQPHACIFFNDYTGKLFADNENDILKRFARVFEQAYTRFLDLQKAEAQAREAQIEAALERVRSRTMGMQKSEELKDIIQVIYNQFIHLNIQIEHTGFIIDYRNRDDMYIWLADKHAIPSQVTIPYFDAPHWNSFNEAKQTGSSFFSNYSNFEEKNKFYQTLFQFIPGLPEEAKDYYFKCPGLAISTVLMDNVALYIENFAGIPYTDEENDTLMRFGKVFQQTYTRFNDLQKAEAQNREAQIELSLERVRAKTMAMHNSQDVADTVATMFDELLKLGVETLRCGIGILQDPGEMELWTAQKGEQGKINLVIGRLDMRIHPMLQGGFQSWKEKREVYHYELVGDDLIEYMRAINDYSDYPIKYDLASLPPTMSHHEFYFPEGILFVFSQETLTAEALKIFKRFASVFGQTYRRYLDLLKAEAQAKEALVEAALERVRSRTMAMHKTDELFEASELIYREFTQLGITSFNVSYAFIQEAEQEAAYYSVNPLDGKIFAFPIIFPQNETPVMSAILRSWKNGEPFGSIALDEASVVKHQTYIGEHILAQLTSNQIEMPFSVAAFVDATPKTATIYSFNFTKGYLFMIREVKLTSAEEEIVLRFTKVFNQTYTRYLDLQKAEAQAREATIEAALEKVRGKAMSMRSSEDLSAAASMVFSELRKLNIQPIRAGVGIIEKETRKVQFYSAASSASGDHLSLTGEVIMTDHPEFEKQYNAWLNNENYFTVLQGEALRSYQAFLFQGLAHPELENKSDQVQYGHWLMFSEGFLFAWADKAYSAAEINVLDRFKKIIELTFRRYYDLQKSETNAREAIKQAALDRVRADIASMRTINDLERITPLIWNELRVLGIPFIRCGVFIMDVVQQQIHTFLSTPEGKAIAAFHMLFDSPGNFSEIVAHWQQKKMYESHWSENDFINLANNLVKQGAIINTQQYTSNLPHEGIFLHFLPFLQGMLYVGNIDRLNEEALHLIQSLADAFSTAYARYEDFNKLELAKQQVEQTLVDLKQAQLQLVQSEKMASLGELTAGIAHEIQNPLNFVNNFSEVSTELVDELNVEMGKGNLIDAKQIAEDLKQNLEKINHHGKRAGDIVRGMLQHSRSSSGQKENTDINKLTDEYLRLAYHGFRAKDKTFNTAMITEYDDTIGMVNIIPQDIGRVVLNLFTNAFYAVTEKRKLNIPSYEPSVTVSTKKSGDHILISVKDNGNGIPQKAVDKIFQPFFTTKPTGQGTGLGLSLSYDIVKAHSGEMQVETKEGEFASFVISLPNR